MKFAKTFSAIAWAMLFASSFGLAGEDAEKSPKTDIQVLDNAASFEHKASLDSAIESYWELHQMNDFGTLYDMFMEAFKQDVTLQDFLKKKRGQVDTYRIHRMRFWGDTCAQVEYRLSMQAEMMNLGNVPMRQIWKRVDGEWMVYENPRSVSMIPRSFGKPKIEKPCPLPKEWRVKKPKGAEIKGAK